MKIIYMGTPEFAIPALDALVQAGHEIVAVYSQPPRPAGRGKALRPSPVHQRAQQLGLHVRTPASLKGVDDQAGFATLDADIAVVAAYGLILPRFLLQATRFGCLNIHASLLPRWRGAAPVQRAILAGDQETGVTIMQMETGLDTGPMLAKSRIAMNGKTAGELTTELAHVGARLMTEVLAKFEAFARAPQPDDGVTYATKITKEEALLDFAAGAAQAERQVRAFNPAPGAFFMLHGERFKVLAAKVEQRPGEPGVVLDDRLLIGGGADSLRPTLIQRAGKGAMGAEELLRGFPIPPGTRLS